MSGGPVWRREGWKPDGPGFCRCPQCKERVTTNALGRAAHERACVQRAAKVFFAKHPEIAAGRILTFNGADYTISDVTWRVTTTPVQGQAFSRTTRWFYAGSFEAKHNSWTVRDA